MVTEIFLIKTKIGIVIAFTHQTANHLIANPLSESPEILIISCIVEFVQGPLFTGLTLHLSPVLMSFV